MTKTKQFFVTTLFMTISVSATAQISAPPPSAPPVSAQLLVTYASNVAQSSEAFASLRGIKLEDVLFSPSAVFDYVKNLGKNSIFLTGSGGYDFYARNTILNRERVDFSAGDTVKMFDCETTAAGTYGRHQSDLVDLAVGTIVNTVQLSSVGVSTRCNRGSRFSPFFSMTRNWTTNSDALQAISDYRGTSLQGSVAYDAGNIGILSLNGQFTDGLYPRRLLSVGGVPKADGFTLYSGGFGLEHNFGSRLKVILSMSETSLKSKAGGNRNFDGLTYNVSVSYQPTSRITTSIAFSEQTNPSNRPNSTYTVAKFVKAEAEYRVSSKMRLRLGATETRESYNGITATTGLDITRETVDTLYASLTYRITPRLSVDLTASRDQTDADISAYSYTGNRIGLSVSQAF